MTFKCASNRKYRMAYCSIHEVFSLREYPHVCDGIRTLPERSALHGVKRGKRTKNASKATGTAGSKGK